MDPEDLSSLGKADGGACCQVDLTCATLFLRGIRDLVHEMKHNTQYAILRVIMRNT